MSRGSLSLSRSDRRSGDTVILEVAILDVKAGRSAEFESAFRGAEPLISSARGHVSHDLQRCIERPDRYILLVRWERLEDHIEGFRRSPRYQEWKRLLHHFYDPFPTVEHYSNISPRVDEGPRT
jgi:heme-degrading monooxygenase HmoA